ncbi:MAG: response regulator, partial [Cyanobacteria bacterium J06649_11]
MKQVGEHPVATQTNSLVRTYSNLQTAKILVVDENPLSRMTASDLLLLDGYEIIEAEDPTLVFQNVVEHQPDLILLNAVMRKLDSFILCRQLKENYS